MKDSRDMRSEVDAYKYFFLRTPVMFNGRFILVFIERNQLRILSGSSTFWLTEERQDQGRIQVIEYFLKKGLYPKSYLTHQAHLICFAAH